MFQAKEAVWLALDGGVAGVACDGCPPLPTCSAGTTGWRSVYGLPVCLHAKNLDEGGLLPNADLSGSVQQWKSIGDEGATFSC